MRARWHGPARPASADRAASSSFASRAGSSQACASLPAQGPLGHVCNIKSVAARLVAQPRVQRDRAVVGLRGAFGVALELRVAVGPGRHAPLAAAGEAVDLFEPRAALRRRDAAVDVRVGELFSHGDVSRSNKTLVPSLVVPEETAGLPRG